MTNGENFTRTFGVTAMTQPLAILTGATAGATESFVVVPFELVKIRLQDKTTKFNGMGEVIKDIIQKNGVLGLYKGLELTMWRHIWWNAGYFGCIHQVKSLMPKPKTTNKRYYLT